MKLAFALVLAAGLATVRAEDKLTVASLSTVLSDVAKHVGGDKIDLIQIVKPGIDPHDFEPTPSDVRAISKAQIVLASGLGFEGYLSKLEQSVGSGPKFVIAGQAIKPIMGFAGDHDDHEGHSHSHGQADESGKTPDPHWFHSVRNIEIVTNLLRDAFIAADPANQAAYTANAKAYQDRLEALSKWVRLQVAQLPKDKRILVTSHDALGYFARDHGFQVLPVEGISTGDQPSSKKVTALIAEIRGAGVKAIFAENIENPKVMQEITRETGAKLGGVIYADGLGDKEAATFEDMIRHNTSTIVNALK